MSEKKRSNFNSTVIIRANVVSKSFISELIMIFIASPIECIWWSGLVIELLLLSLSSPSHYRTMLHLSQNSYRALELNEKECINLLIYYRLWLICRIFIKINPFRLCNQFIKFNFNKRQFVSVAAACIWTRTLKYCGRLSLIKYNSHFPLSWRAKILCR